MARRGQNEGSIHKRADGRWAAYIHLGYQKGTTKRVRKFFYGRTRAEVQQKLTKALVDRDNGRPVLTEKQTVERFLNDWLENTVKPTLRPKTLESYTIMIRKHLNPTIGSHALGKLSPQHVQAMLREKLESGLSSRTVQYLRVILVRALGQALKWGLINTNPAALVTPPRVEKKEVKPLTLDEARAFLSACRGDRLEACFTVALALGLRRGEALGLRWGDIDLGSQTLTVRTQLQRIGGKLVLTEPKTKQSRRMLALPPSIVTALEAHRKRQLEEKLAFYDRWEETNMVFTTRYGTPIDPRNLFRHFQAILKKAGIPARRFHDLRHACATMLLAQGVPIRSVMDLLGHTVISTTMDIYAHVLPEMRRETADLMDRILAGAK